MKKNVDLELIVKDREILKELMVQMLYKPSVVLTGLSNNNYDDRTEYKLKFTAELNCSANEKDLAMDGRNTKELKTSNSELASSKSEIEEWCNKWGNEVLQRG